MNLRIADLTGKEHQVFNADNTFVINDKTYGDPYEISSAEDGELIVLINVNAISFVVVES